MIGQMLSENLNDKKLVFSKKMYALSASSQKLPLPDQKQ